MAMLLSNDGTLSHSFCSSFMAAGDRMSGLMDSAWPNFMYAGPRLVTMFRNWIALLTCKEPAGLRNVVLSPQGR